MLFIKGGNFMLVTSKELFQKAQQQHFAIPAPNFIDLESLRWHMETAEKSGCADGCIGCLERKELEDCMDMS